MTQKLGTVGPGGTIAHIVKPRSRFATSPIALPVNLSRSPIASPKEA